MTLDNAGVDFLGTLESVSGDGLTVTTTPFNRTAFSTAPVLGGMLIVVNGPMAGQWRRIVGAEGGGAGLIRRSYQLDRPISGLDTQSLCTTTPFRGRMIFHRNRYRDVGAFQVRPDASFGSGPNTKSWWALVAVSARHREHYVGAHR